MTEGFLAAHADLRWRGAGVEAYGKRDYPLALTYFQRAARYADKASQAMVGKNVLARPRRTAGPCARLHLDGLGGERL